MQKQFEGKRALIDSWCLHQNYGSVEVVAEAEGI